MQAHTAPPERDREPFYGEIDFMLEASRVHSTIGRHQLADGYPLVVDLERSHGVWLFDALSESEYLDTFTCFASWPIGFNHPRMADAAFQRELMSAAGFKIASADLYTREMAAFVDAFAGRVTPPEYPHHFWISGGSLAVENALKVAFDWKARKLGRTDFAEDVNDLVIIHFERAFHGRSGYTMSLTNTVPDKVGLFPKFDWPRVHSPAIEFDLDGHIANDIEAEEQKARSMIESAFAQHRGKVAAILIEPMQGEGGDNHFRPEFLAALRTYADEQEAMLIFDEVQTGFFGSGRAWLWQHCGVSPDVVAFGKKSQICGIYANSRVDEVDDNVFQKSSRINSTWGGNLVDMVRCRKFIEIIEQDDLAGRVVAVGDRFVRGLREIARDTGTIRNVRGVGSLVAFTAADPGARDRLIKSMFALKLIVLPCGRRSVRFRLPFVMTDAEADEALARAAQSIGSTHR